MKKFVFILLFIIPISVFPQVEIILEVNQPPELGYELSKQDTTIEVGDSVTIANDIVIFGGSGEYYYRWAPSETLDDPTLINPVATPADTTIYVLSVTDNNGCNCRDFSMTYTVNVKESSVNTEAIPEDKFPLKVILYPNPNDGLFKVELKGLPADNIFLSVIDNAGRHIYNKNISNFAGKYIETFHLKLASGVYFLEVVVSDRRLKRQFIIN